MIGGLFSGAKKKAADATASSQGSASTSAAPAPASNGLVTVAEITTETTAITGGAIPADQFEIPADWKKIIPKERAEKEVTCPKPGEQSP
jgi:hypothetical protein